MAERRGPTDGKRFKRITPSGNHKKNKRQPIVAPVKTWRGETLMSPEMRDKLVNLIRAGNYAHIAAATCGVHRSTFDDWLKKGARGEQPYKDLTDAVEQAAAESEAGIAAQIRGHGTTHWQALAWMLERTRHRRWGRRDQLTLANDEEHPITDARPRVDLSKLSVEELRELKRMRDKARTEDEDGGE